MGLWWKSVEEVPKGGIHVYADSDAWPKWNPLWRFQHKWKIFEVNSGGKPYYVYFDDGKNMMLYKKVIKTKYFAARIGNRSLRFAAVTDLLDSDSVPIYKEDSKYLTGPYTKI